MSQANSALIDRFGRKHDYLRISVTDRCNFRCTYCMPHEDVDWTPRSEILSFEEIERSARLFVSLGVNKIRLTGGEPTTRKGLVDLVQRLSNIEGLDHLLLTTNGDALPTLASPLRQAGISGVNISLDTLRSDRFFEITQRDKLDHVLKGIETALSVGFETVKINVVVMSGVNDDELCDFVERFHNQAIEVRFIEFMPFLANDWEKTKLVTYANMRKKLEERYTLLPIPGQKSDVAKEFMVDGANMRVGFITSMTDNFCGGCNRVRLSSDGRLKVCLFAKSGPSLRDAMRSNASNAEIAEVIRIALDGKWAGHPPMNRLIEVNDLPMIGIGG